ncbi:hypothetical protein [Pseudomonas fulva]|uniref:hypothetical protein n=1 Tax=Pseudomonas fulva TaxID=47880 RepID=UPI0018AA2211|nr:hypothetical protein [Pseudomonas fulva]MBF8774409.1 hypothetical protein [Pseudomonas fulva]
MAKTFQIILGYVEKPVGGGAASTALVDQYNSNQAGFSLVNQSAQTGAAVAGVTSIVKLTAGFTPMLNIKTNTLAATTVFLKITAQYRTDQTFNKDDVVSLVGNISGVVGSIAFLAGGGAVAVGFTAVGVATNVMSIVSAEAAANLFHSLVLPIWQKHFVEHADGTYPGYWVAPNLNLATLSEISAIYADSIAVSHWDPETNDVRTNGGSLHHYYSVGGGGVGYVENGSTGSVPLVFPLPVSPGWRVDIGPLQVINPGGFSGGLDRYH